MRRSRGDGTVYKRKDGRYAASCWVETTAGIKRIHRYAKTRKDAEALLVELRKMNQNGMVFGSKEDRLGTYMDYWLILAKTRLSMSTVDGYESIVRIHLKPGLGNKYLTKLKVPDVQLFLNNKLQTGESVRSVQKMRIVLSAVLKNAMKEERLFRNVAHDTDLPIYEPKEAVPWSPDELGRFLTSIESHSNYPIFFIMSLYGLRTSEALGLSWSDIDTLNNVIKVRKQLEYRDKTFSYTRLKTKSSSRELPLLPVVADMLSTIPKVQSGPLPDLIFKSASGNPIDRYNLRKKFQRLSKAADLRPITLHHLRHTAATNLKNYGIDIKTAQSILGHSNISTTLQFYQHTNIANKTEALSHYAQKITESIASSRQLKPSSVIFSESVVGFNSSDNDKSNGNDLKFMSPAL